MAPGYEWVFVIVYATMGFGTLVALHDVYATARERRARKSTQRHRSHRPRPPRQVF